MASAKLQPPRLHRDRLRALAEDDDLTDLTDVAITGDDLANRELRGASWLRVELAGCRMTGVSLAETTLTDCVLRDCRIDLATLGFARLSRVRIEDCRLSSSDLIDAELRDVVLERCDLTGADLRGLKISRVELRGCTLDQITGADRLRGVAMPWHEILANATTWAAALGITATDD